jgi:hypothetical protein
MEGGCNTNDDDDDTQQQHNCVLWCDELYSIAPAPFPNQRADILQMRFCNSSDRIQLWPGHGTDPIGVLLRTFG